MGGSGHISQMNKMLKENRAAKRSQRKGFKDGYTGMTLSKKKLKFKELPPEKLKKVLKQIQFEQSKRRRKQLLLFWSIIILGTVIMWVTFEMS